MDILCLGSLSVSEPSVRKNTVTSKITLRHLNGKTASFDLKIRYEETADEKYLDI